MKQKNLLLPIFVIFLLCSCTEFGIETKQITNNKTETPLPTKTLYPTTTFTPTNTQTQIPTNTPTPTNTPEYYYPIPYGTSFPPPSEIINSENINQLKQVSVIGQGLFGEIEWSPDRKFFVVTRSIGVYLFEFQTMEQVLTIPFQSNANSMILPYYPGIAFSNDSHFFAVSSTEGIFVFELSTMNRILIVPPDLYASSIEFMPNNNNEIAACLIDGTVNLYNIQDKKLSQTIGTPETKQARCQIQISGDGNRMVWWAFENVHSWDLVENLPGKDLALGYIGNFVLSRDGSTLAVTRNSGGFFSSTELWDTKTGSRITILYRHKIGAYSKTTDLLATYLDITKPYSILCSDKISVWNLSNHQLKRELVGSEGYSTIEFNPEGNQLAASYDGFGCSSFTQQIQNRYIKIWNIETGEIIGEHVAALATESVYNFGFGYQIRFIYKPTFVNDDRITGLIYSSSEPNSLFVWNKFGEAPDELIFAEPIVEDISFDMNGLTVNISKKDFEEFQYNFESLLSPDLKYKLARNVTKYNLELINNIDGKVLQDFGFRGFGKFSPNSDLLVIFKEDRTYGDRTWLEIWDLITLQPLRTILVLADTPIYLNFSPDQKILITGSLDRTFLIWGIEK